MANLKDSVIAKLKKNGKTFEILVDCEKALLFKSGKNVSIEEVLFTEEIFYDAKKGTKASEHELMKLFGTEDKLEVSKIIIKEGHVPLTAELIRKQTEQKRKLIVTLIQKAVIDPKTGKPHPPQRIEAAITEAKVKIDDNKTAEQQVADIVDKIKIIIPIKYEVRELNVKISVQYAAKSYGTLKQLGKIIAEKWENDGSLNSTIEIPASMQEEFEIALNNITKGNVDIKILRSR